MLRPVLRTMLRPMLRPVLRPLLRPMLRPMLRPVLRHLYARSHNPPPPVLPHLLAGLCLGVALVARTKQQITAIHGHILVLIAYTTKHHPIHLN
jgi:hypothetical protein